MALSANSVFEVRTAGNDTNGGGYVTGSGTTDYSQQDAKNTVGNNISTSDVVAIGTATLTSAGASFDSNITGNIIYLQGGTGSLTAGWYQATFVSSTSITVDRNVAAGTQINMNIGGALASPGMAGGVGLVSGNIIYIKAGTYTIASASTNIATGCFSSTLAILIMEGYNGTRGDLGTPPLLQASGISTFAIITASGGTTVNINNISVDGASLTSSRGIVANGVIQYCKAANCTNSGLVQSTAVFYSNCTATGCATTGSAFNGGRAQDCVAYDNTVSGFGALTGGAVRCIADSCTGTNIDGFNGISGQVTNCVSYNSGRDGFRAGANTVITNCIAYGNATTQINYNSANGCSGFNNATVSGGIVNTTGKGSRSVNPVVLTADPFVDAANQNFALNTTSGGGAALRAAGYPGVLPIGGTGYLDIGTLQHADPASSGGVAGIIGDSAQW